MRRQPRRREARQNDATGRMWTSAVVQRPPQLAERQRIKQSEGSQWIRSLQTPVSLGREHVFPLRTAGLSANEEAHEQRHLLVGRQWRNIASGFNLWRSLDECNRLDSSAASEKVRLPK